MGKIYSGNGWILKVHGNEHPPIHAHLLHPDGKATIAIDGHVQNSGIPNKIINEAKDWLLTHQNELLAEWNKMNNPQQR
jgi:hypothetical protein